MKKWLNVLAIGIILVLLSLCCIACGPAADNNDDDTTPDENNQQGQLQESFKTQAEIQAQLKNYSFEYKLTYFEGEEERITTYVDIQTQDAWLYGVENTIFVADRVNEDLYMLDPEDMIGTVMNLETMDSFSGWGLVLFNWHNDISHLKKTGTATVLNRACNKYGYKLGTIEYTYYIDKEYDICLKYEINESITSAQTEFTFTKFKVGNVTTQEILGIIDDYDVTDYRDMFD